MKHILRLTAVGVALTGLLVAVPEAAVGRASYLTFSGPVALPGVTLDAGSYKFDMPADSDLSVVRISSRDGSRVFLMAFTRIVNRPRAVAADQHVTLGEARPGEARPIHTWYPSGKSTGREFIY